MNRAGPKRRPTNKLPTCLQDEENNILVEMLGTNSYSLAGGVAQLIQGNSRRQWEKVDVGVVCFVKDYTDKAYFLRLFDLNRRSIVFEQMLYDNFQVRAPGNVERLLTFEGDKCVYGLNFALLEEARAFRASLDKCYEQQQKHKRRGSASMVEDNYNNYTSTPLSSSSGYGSSANQVQMRNPPRPNNQTQISSNNIVIPTSNPVAGDLFTTSNSTAAAYKKSGGGAPSRRKPHKDTKKKKLTKSDIGLPTNFEHRVHVGWDPSKGLQSNSQPDEELEPSIKQLLEKIGMHPKNLKQEDRKFIYEFVDHHGGMDQLKKELIQQQQPPPVPPPPPSRQPGTYRQHAAAPPPPPRDPVSAAADRRPLPPTPRSGPSPVTGPTPPPPPPMPSGLVYRPSDTPPPPPPPISSLPRVGVPPAPPPPPPPPAFGASPPPPPPPPPVGSFSMGSAAPPPPPPQPSGGRSDLLKQIQEGKSLRHVDSPVVDTPSGGVGRDKLMDSIRLGVTLRETPKEARQERVTPPEQMGGIAGALARALAERRPQIESDESESESDDDEQDADDDEWGD